MLGGVLRLRQHVTTSASSVGATFNFSVQSSRLGRVARVCGRAAPTVAREWGSIFFVHSERSIGGRKVEVSHCRVNFGVLVAAEVAMAKILPQAYNPKAGRGVRFTSVST